MAAIGNQIDAAFVFARSDLVNVCDPEKTQTMKKPMTRSRAAKKKALAITRAKPNKRSALSTRTKPPTPFDRFTRARARQRRRTDRLCGRRASQIRLVARSPFLSIMRRQESFLVGPQERTLPNSGGLCRICSDFRWQFLTR